MLLAGEKRKRLSFDRQKTIELLAERKCECLQSTITNAVAEWFFELAKLSEGLYW